MEWDWRASEVGARRKTKQKPAMVEPVEIPDAEHELVVDRGAAIDVAKAAGKVCVRLPGKSGRRFSRVWDVPARTGAITELAEQLVELGIEKVTVESTSDYWRIWYYLLEDAGLDVQLVNSRDVRNVPGRPKTDKLDAVWLAKLTEKGLLRPSFVPPAPIRVLRDYTRLREDLIRERTRYWQRLEKLLEDAAIKVSAVASKLDTLSTRDMVEALIGGERDSRRLADLARGRMKTKRSELITALDGRFDDHHAELARLLLGQIDALTAQIGALSARIERLIDAMDESDHPTGDRGRSGGGGPQVTGAPSTGGQATAPARRTTTAIGVDSDTATVVEPQRLTAVERLDEITAAPSIWSMPFQSDTTKPEKPSSPLSTVVMRYWLPCIFTPFQRAVRDHHRADAALAPPPGTAAGGSPAAPPRRAGCCPGRCRWWCRRRRRSAWRWPAPRPGRPAWRPAAR